MPNRHRLCVALLLVAVASGFVSSFCHAQDANRMAASFSLDDYQEKNRLLLVFAPSTRSPAYEKQMTLFETATEELAERDLLFVYVLLEGQSRAGDEPISDDDAARLRQQFGVGEAQFRLILVGKDGAEKRRDEAPVQPEAIFQEIDAVPMRQREMREAQNGG